MADKADKVESWTCSRRALGTQERGQSLPCLPVPEFLIHHEDQG